MKCTVIAVLSLPAGSRLGLTSKQAARRAHALRAEGKGRYIATAPVQFKVGEVIDYVGELPKHLAVQLERPAAAAAAPPAVVAPAVAGADADQASLV